MAKLSNKPILDAANGLKPDRYPIWFLRQAGRYLPEYQEIRAKMSFLELCRNPKKAAEVTIQPLKRFDLDAAIIFSDILIPPAHMGQNLTFDKGHGPVLTPPIRTAKDLLKLKIPDDSHSMNYVGDAISLTKTKLSSSQTMIGFAGAPFTVASYMIEGSGSKTYSEVKKMMWQQPQVFSQLLDILSEVTVSYLKMQIEAGAEAVMLFDSWAGNLTPQDYSKYILPSLKKLTASLKEHSVPVVYYSGQGASNLMEVSDLHANVFAIDWRVSMSYAGSIFKSHQSAKALQGNLDPLVLSWGDETTVRTKVKDILDQAKTLSPLSHIFNVGHGVLPTTSPDAINWAIDEIRSQRP